MPTKKEKEKERKEEEAKKAAPKKAEEPKVAVEEQVEEEKKPEEKKPAKVEKPKVAKKHKEEKGAHALYKIEGDKVARLRPTCERCGIGYFMADHHDRYTCGHCGFTRYKHAER